MSDKIIDLIQIEPPDCACCEEKSKRVTGKTFDTEGPGKVGVIYDCENEHCKKRKQAIELFHLRVLGLLGLL